MEQKIVSIKIIILFTSLITDIEFYRVYYDTFIGRVVSCTYISGNASINQAPFQIWIDLKTFAKSTSRSGGKTYSYHS